MKKMHVLIPPTPFSTEVKKGAYIVEYQQPPPLCFSREGDGRG